MTKRKTVREIIKEQDEEREAAAKRHRPVNKQIRDARGTTVSVSVGTPESHTAMGKFVRSSAGKSVSNGKDNDEAIMARRRAAAKEGYILAADGETIRHDFREEMEEED